VTRAVVLAALAAAGGLLLLLGERPGPADDPQPSLPPIEVRCDAAPDARVRRGREASSAATAAIARYPFDAREGLAALQRLLQAERCFELAGERVARAQAGARATAWRARLQGDCRDRFLRYRLARASERLQHALADVEFLLALCAPERGPLATRLRRAQIEISERNDSQEPP
jgi:hypothetical protein